MPTRCNVFGCNGNYNKQGPWKKWLNFPLTMKKGLDGLMCCQINDSVCFNLIRYMPVQTILTVSGKKFVVV